MEDQRNQIEIWFFIGILLFLYGVLILGAGIYHLFFPPLQQMTLNELHPDLWWGGILLAIGLFYGVKYWPFRKSSVTS
jgi:hypothetical protein